MPLLHTTQAAESQDEEPGAKYNFWTEILLLGTQLLVSRTEPFSLLLF